MKFRRWIAAGILAACSSEAAARKGGQTKDNSGVIDPLRHDVYLVNPRNFDSLIQKYRDRFPAAILFYTKSTPDLGKLINEEWDGVAKELKGLARIGAVDCDEHLALCEAHQWDASKGPQVRIFPPLPMPARAYDRPIAKKAIISHLTKLVPPGKIEVVTDAAMMLKFVGVSPSIPKVILFTEKTRPSPMLNALANTFSDRISFAMTSGPLGSTELHKQFHVKKLPTLLLKKGDLSVGLKGVQLYRGELDFHALHEWINVHSETFVRGGGFVTDQEAKADVRPWLADKLPEMAKASHKDICFNKPKGLCAVYITDLPMLKPEETAMLETLAERYSSPALKPSFHWSWLNIDVEHELAKLLKIQSSSLPSLVVFNPHTRVRYAKLPEDQVATSEAITEFIDRISAGDGRFTLIKGNKLPAWTVRKKKATDEAGDLTPTPNSDEL